MNQKTRKYQRSLKNLLILPGYQLRLMLWILVVVIVVSLIQLSAMYAYYNEALQVMAAQFPQGSGALAQIHSDIRGLSVIGALVLLGILMGLAFLILIRTHHTAGPLFHFRRVFSAIKEGNIKARIRLRNSDEFRDIASEFNLMMDTLEKKLDRHD